jgi:hypothetical protein
MIVPWGADLAMIERALREVCARAAQGDFQ